MKTKTVALREAKNRFSAAVNEAQTTVLIITRHGRPAAAIIGIDGLDLVDATRELEKFAARRTR